MAELDFDLLLGDPEELGGPEKAKALAASLRRQRNMGLLGQMMNLEPTVRAGGALQENAAQGLRTGVAQQQFGRQQAQRRGEQATATSQWQSEQAATAARHADQMRNERARIEQGGAEAKRQWSAIADPITGDIMLYNALTGETRRAGQGDGPAGGPRPLPMFNPERGMKPTEKEKTDLSGINQQRAAIQGAVGAVEQRPGAFGITAGNVAEQFGGPVGSALAQWSRNPQDTQARAYVLNNVSTIINERAGAAQSMQELARLRGFLPNETDNPERVKAKFNAFLDYLDEREGAIRGYTGEQLGHKPRGQTPFGPDAQQAPRAGDRYMNGG
jgi:hypothetical protein